MITVKDLSFGYKRGQLFNGLNLEMQRGNIYGLLGLNGAGKTTFLKLLCGLLFPQSGEVRVFGENPSRRIPKELSRIFVLPEELNVPSISEQEYMISRTPFYPYFNHSAFERNLREFNIPRNKKLSKLSYGQKKKFFLSFGLASGSELLILDEPSNGLDIPSKGIFRRMVAESLSEDRIFVISTHQVRDIDSLIDPLIILHEGKVLFEHSIEEIHAHIHMTHTNSPPMSDAPGLLYNEAVVGGYWSVWSGEDISGGSIDLEVLFNTFITKPDIYDKIFATQGATV